MQTLWDIVPTKKTKDAEILIFMLFSYFNKVSYIVLQILLVHDSITEKGL